MASLADTMAATALMDRLYRRRWWWDELARQWLLPGPDRLIAELRPAPGDAVLEIGSGSGRNLILAARRYPQAQLFGIDVSTTMLTAAIGAIERAGLAGRVRVAHADATTFDAARLFGRPRFERIMISYSLSMMPQWRRALDLAFSLLAENGRLHLVDFGRQAGWPALPRALLRAWLKRLHVRPPDALEAELFARAARAGAIVTLTRPLHDYVQYAVVDAVT